MQCSPNSFDWPHESRYPTKQADVTYTSPPTSTVYKNWLLGKHKMTQTKKREQHVHKQALTCTHGILACTTSTVLQQVHKHRHEKIHSIVHSLCLGKHRLCSCSFRYCFIFACPTFLHQILLDSKRVVKTSWLDGTVGGGDNGGVFVLASWDQT